MFKKPLTRAPRYILIKPFFLAIGGSYLLDLSHMFVYGDLVYAQTWKVLTLKNYIEPP